LDEIRGYQPVSEEQRQRESEEETMSDAFWAKVQKVAVISILLFFGGFFVFTGIRACSSREGSNDIPASVGLERIANELELVKGELLDAEQRATELTSELHAARAELRRSAEYSQQLEVQLGNAGIASTAIGNSIGVIDGANTAIGGAIRNIDDIISAANKANSVP
jgi:hypothetical protein